MKKILYLNFYFIFFLVLYFLFLAKPSFAASVTCDSPDGISQTVYTGANSSVTLTYTGTIYDDIAVTGTRDISVVVSGPGGNFTTDSYYADASWIPVGGARSYSMPITYQGGDDNRTWTATVNFPGGSFAQCTGSFTLAPPCLSWSRPLSCEGLTSTGFPPVGNCTLCSPAPPANYITYTAGSVTACTNGAHDCTTGGGQSGQYKSNYENQGYCNYEVWDCQGVGMRTYRISATSYACNYKGVQCTTDILNNCPYKTGDIGSCPADPPPPVVETPAPTPTPGGATPTPTPTSFPSLPTIISLKTSMSSGPTPFNGYTFSATPGYSGNSSGEGGYNWYNNLMVIRLDAALGVGGSHGTNVNQLAVGFYNKSLGLATSLNDLKNKLYTPSPSYPTKGFLFSVGYIPGAPTPPWFYAFDNSTNNWVSITNSSSPNPYQLLPSTAWSFVPFAIGGSISPAPYYGIWGIYIAKNFGSKNMYTAVYAADDAGNTTFLGNFTVTQ